ncbi:hypothetical protein WA026_018267 [Henosepilachna vigintioctopunctata]|uniref:Leucine-rich repeat-containing protein 71 n=1 Tax=Henosepilachna vigintioctopunctata TaxID=420089 RepID=A0AAW1V9N9_9CUCU
MSFISNKGKGINKDRISVTKLGKSSLLTNEIPSLRLRLAEIVGEYDPKLKTIFLDGSSNKSKSVKDDDRIHCPTILIFLESANKLNIKAIHWKNFSLSGKPLPILLEFCGKYISLNTLRLESAQLQESDIKLLETFLKSNSNITDLDLSGNTYRSNFSSLLIDTKLKYLTLKFCNIDHEGLRDLIQPLKSAYHHSLIHLNLTSNIIGDIGAEEIASLLRINRVLISLNLCRNNITNDGATRILESLQSFHLNTEEISKRRMICYQYYIQKYEQMKAYTAPDPSLTTLVSEDLKSSSLSSAVKVKSKKSSKMREKKASKLSTSLVDLSSKSFSRTNTYAPSNIFIPPIADISDLVEVLDYQSAYHPFVKETMLDGFDFICRGNFVLKHLNISFNLLTEDILGRVCEMLMYQMSNGSSQEGLNNIIIYGNRFKSETAERMLLEIYDLLSLKMTNSSSGSLSIKGSKRDLRSRSKSSTQ